ncbi:hypothetical protein QQY24_30250 [Streptomyces sp. TG1A-8]|uniref:hypothetical protein n=1 Tax=Streptomyces sp. TG1A-8 TaxID=3051385 RepID=UPI00265B98C6|nr:hypothetical protein [Streptomyces sp. TG1A-8]MDO0929479.1 hypothetical protein [Streptomyces sp. TG1A-8]
MLPGPPRECLPMLDTVLRDGLGHLPEPEAVTTVFRRTLGVIEADAAAAVDALVQDLGLNVKPAYRWHYPYVDVRIDCPPDSAAELAKRLDEALGTWVVTSRERTAVQELAVLLDDRGLALDVDDRVTGGRFTAELAAERQTARTGTESGRIPVTLDATWDGGSPERRTGTVRLLCGVGDRAQEHTRELTVPNRGPEVAGYAGHFAAWTIVRRLTEETA